MNRNARLSKSVLDDIVAAKRDEIARLRGDSVSLRARAEGRAAHVAATASFDDSLRRRADVGVIAELKRRSPSSGEISAGAPAGAVARVYADAGAAAISVLTDGPHFGGSLKDLEAVGAEVAVPLLRKDFTLDPLQVYEAGAAGAAAILLIVRLLDDAQLADLGTLAAELRMSALVEVHDEAELDRALRAGARIVGVNSRDLASFTTDLGVAERLARHVPAEVVLVGESGIRELADVQRLASAGVDAVLVGEALMRAPDPAALVAAFSSVPRTRR